MSVSPNVPLVSISDAQRLPLPDANFIATVQHGLPVDLLRPRNVTPSYLAFLGRICPEKRPDRAIRIARAAGIPLKIAAKVDRVDEAYFRDTIRPMIDGRNVELIGEISDAEKPDFLSGAHRAAGADRLAGAVRAGDDRGDGLRHAGDRVQPRLGAGDHRARRDRLIVEDEAEAGRGDPSGCRICPALGCVAASSSGSAPSAWPRTISLYIAAWPPGSAPRCAWCART